MDVFYGEPQKTALQFPLVKTSYMLLDCGTVFLIKRFEHCNNGLGHGWLRFPGF